MAATGLLYVRGWGAHRPRRRTAANAPAPPFRASTGPAYSQRPFVPAISRILRLKKRHGCDNCFQMKLRWGEPRLPSSAGSSTSFVHGQSDRFETCECQRLCSNQWRLKISGRFKNTPSLRVRTLRRAAVRKPAATQWAASCAVHTLWSFRAQMLSGAPCRTCDSENTLRGWEAEVERRGGKKAAKTSFSSVTLGFTMPRTARGNFGDFPFITAQIDSEILPWPCFRSAFRSHSPTPSPNLQTCFCVLVGQKY